MGSVFGKESVAEPAFDVLMQHTPTQGAKTSYELRQYGERFAAEAQYNAGDDNSPFRLLAQYIGVFGSPQNEAAESISMTAPVMKGGSNNNNSNSGGDHPKGGTAIAMTAPVMKSAGDDKTMAFVLPAEYNELSKIPKPTNPAVQIKSIPPQVGVVHRYSGSMDDARSEQIALELADQLRNDGVDITDSHAAQSYSFFGYNPPFCLPPFRRNEVWIELTTEQAEKLVQDFNPTDAN